jgi:hypothetical protein
LLLWRFTRTYGVPGCTVAADASGTITARPAPAVTATTNAYPTVRNLFLRMGVIS